MNKVCECGCGKPAPLAAKNDAAKGWVRGQPIRFVLGHGRGFQSSRPLMTHGMTNTPTHTCWQAMLRRCRNPNHVSYPRYGGRGVRVCDRWQGEHGFQNFLADVGPRPSLKHTIDRFPNKTGNYEPGNVRWATYKEQRANQRQ